MAKPVPTPRDKESSSASPSTASLAARLVDAFPVDEGDYKVADIQADDLLEKALGALADIATADDMKHPPLMRNKARRIYYEIREELTLRAARLVDPPPFTEADIADALDSAALWKQHYPYGMTGGAGQAYTAFLSVWSILGKLETAVTTLSAGRLVDPSPPDIERELRMEWWLNHGLKCLPYGDDGEMQCCGLDFKRMPLDELRPRVNELRLRRISESIARVNPSPLAQLSENKEVDTRVDGDTQVLRRQDLPQSGNGR